MTDINEAKRRYHAAAHAMQSGVAYDPTSKSLEPKHLRVGINSAMVDHAALVGLLMEKGIISEEEYYAALADGMEAEAKRYADELSKKLGKPVTLA